MVAYEHSSEVNSSKLDSIMIEMACNEFDETSDPDYDGTIDKGGYAYFHNFKDLLNAKTQLSNPGRHLHDFIHVQIMSL